METQNNYFKLKRISHFIPSSFTSCQFRTLPDVAESSISITKPNKSTSHFHENDHSSFKTQRILKRNLLLNHTSGAGQGRKCPPVKPFSPLNPKRKDDKKSGLINFNQSSSSNSGWFTSSDEKTRDDGETETFFSLSSNSGDSFRLKSSRRFKKCEEMKSIDETGRCSFSSSINSYNTVLSKSRRRIDSTAAGKTISKESKKSSKTWPEYELGYDQISTQIYYNDEKCNSGTRDRLRKTVKNRRKTRKDRSETGFKGTMIEESYPVEMSSVDPRSDFRESMVEMILEKQMFGAEELERLLLCFLSLNEVSYHGMIFDVFSEICQTLFSN
ncbi:hypothetical protein CDL12_24053 [Handroanthus impetiginosus]|uniref:Transcription repressor n=1 Tax=Handroanthus impetiginosus TaxID=429701 RepID=A0A2G9GDY5_9LAMI|nr:hypothetical protein CDL12_24053 [Handroanthus impetiginosus]